MKDYQSQIDEKNLTIMFLEEEVRQLKEELQLSRRNRFGSSSEKSAHPGMASLFPDNDEALQSEDSVDSGQEDSAGDEPKEDEVTVGPYKRKKKQTNFPEHLKRKRIELKLTADEMTCTCCSGEMVKISEQISEKLHTVPAQHIVHQYVKPVMSCKKCQEIKTAKMPLHPIPGAKATPETIAQIIVQKYVYGLPLNRIEAMFKRQGIEVSRDKMSRWVTNIGAQVTPLVAQLQSSIISSGFMTIDESGFQVLREENRRPDQKSYIIVQTGGVEAGRKAVVFNYETSRSCDTIAKHIRSFEGHVVTDGLGVYASLFSKRSNIVHGGCWSHARRKFAEAIKGIKKDARKIPVQILKLIDELFAIERAIKDKPPDEILFRREKYSKALIASIEDLLGKYLGTVPKSSLTGKAMNYLDSQWGALTRFLKHAILPIHNNHVEQQIRQFAIGRRAWLFSTSVAGANASSAFYSLVSTAKINGLNPEAYLHSLVKKIASESDLEKLLPYASFQA